jgi:hypothetical protein
MTDFALVIAFITGVIVLVTLAYAMTATLNGWVAIGQGLRELLAVCGWIPGTAVVAAAWQTYGFEGISDALDQWMTDGDWFTAIFGAFFYVDTAAPLLAVLTFLYVLCTPDKPAKVARERELRLL